MLALGSGGAGSCRGLRLGQAPGWPGGSAAPATRGARWRGAHLIEAESGQAAWQSAAAAASGSRCSSPAALGRAVKPFGRTASFANVLSRGSSPAAIARASSSDCRSLDDCSRQGGATTSLSSAGTWALHRTGLSSSFADLATRERLHADRAVRLMLAVDADFDVACWVSLEDGEVDSEDLPIVLAGGRPCRASYKGGPDGIAGSLVLEGFREGINFRVMPRSPGGDSGNYVAEPGKSRAVVTLAAPRPGSQESPGSVASPACPAPALPSGAAGAPGVTVELRLVEDATASKLAVRIRAATELEAVRAAGSPSARSVTCK